MNQTLTDVPEPPADAPQTHRRPRVAVIFGGRSSEHAISCVTAGGVLRAIDRAAYDVVPIGITTTGRWVLAQDDPALLEIATGRLPQVDDAGPAVALALEAGRHELQVVQPGQPVEVLGAVDVVFPLLHGPYGEDGTLQGLLELADIPYVGSAVLASAASMDKHYMKVLLKGHGFPVGPYAVITDREWRTDPAAARQTAAGLGWPVFVKPARAGSSVGISRVEREADLDAAIEAARAHDLKVVVEAALEGREIECAVLDRLDGGPPDTSLPGEIEVLGGHAFYDFEAKYLEEDAVRLTCPAELTDEQADEVRRLSAGVFDALGCEGLARVDTFVSRRPGGPITVNEINTMPGFTPFSMYPRMWQATGLGYPELVDRLIRLALTRRTGLR